MPELPEVEVSRRGIQPHVQHQRITAVRVHQPRLRWLVPETVQQLVGEHITGVSRRAKYLLLHTAKGELIIHLGMSGKLRVVHRETPLQKHDHVEVELASNQVLRLNDTRRFGAVLWQPADAPLALLSKLGPEPLTEAFTGEYLYQYSRERKNAVKNFIMDNHIVVGVGNIYANEALFMSGIDPRRSAGRISRARYERLATAIKTVLVRAIERGGTTLRDFTRTDGQPGYFKIELAVYGRGGETCVTCHSGLREIRLGQRSTVFCPRCQS